MDWSKILNRTKIKTGKYINKGKIDKAIVSLETVARVLYCQNSCFCDMECEELLKRIGDFFIPQLGEECMPEEKSIMFYDSFALDTRGLAYIYLNALDLSGYKIVYVTDDRRSESGKTIPLLLQVLNRNNHSVEYIKGSGSEKIRQIMELIIKYNCSSILLYCLPDDIAGYVAAMVFKGQLKRFLIDLTDHAFWIGAQAFDYSIVFRDFGANTEVLFRNIKQSQVLKLPYHPIEYGTVVGFQGYPDSSFENKRFVFSGGALYKTKNEQGTYYRIINDMLTYNTDILFWYAGEGDSTELQQLMQRFPRRVYYTHERRDLHEIMKRAYLYISTFPFVGGLMTQYAVYAGTIPLTLLNDDNSRGILLSNNVLKLEFWQESELISEINRLLGDNDYYLNVKNKLILSRDSLVISPDSFMNNLVKIIDEQLSDYEIEYKNELNCSYLGSYQLTVNDDVLCQAFASRDNIFLFPYFSEVFIKKVIRRIKQIKRE